MIAWQWRNGNPPRNGDYLVADKLWQRVTVGTFVGEMARPWCIDGRWLPADAVEAWDFLPPLPSGPDQA